MLQILCGIVCESGFSTEGQEADVFNVTVDYMT